MSRRASAHRLVDRQTVLRRRGRAPAMRGAPQARRRVRLLVIGHRLADVGVLPGDRVEAEHRVPGAMADILLTGILALARLLPAPLPPDAPWPGASASRVG